jgi:hypothetical protein
MFVMLVGHEALLGWLAIIGGTLRVRAFESGLTPSRPFALQRDDPEPIGW